MSATREYGTKSALRPQLGVVVAVSAAAIGVIYGYDTGVIAGVLLFVPKQFHLSTSETSSIATAVALGMIVGALLASRVANAIGRRITMISIAGGYVVFAALSAVAQNIIWLDGARFLLGVTIIYFTPLIFKQMGLTGNAALLLIPGVIQLAALLATLVALRLVDRVGRRLVLLIGITTMIVANALLIVVFAVGVHGGVSSLAFVGVLLFTCGFDFGFGAMVWVYSSESFPGRLRSAGASAMLTADLVGNLLIAQFFLGVLGRIGGVATFTLFGVLSVLAFVFVLVLAPETKGRPLESIRRYWENGGHWPIDTAGYSSGPSDTAAAVTRP